VEEVSLEKGLRVFEVKINQVHQMNIFDSKALFHFVQSLLCLGEGWFEGTFLGSMF